MKLKCYRATHTVTPYSSKPVDRIHAALATYSPIYWTHYL